MNKVKILIKKELAYTFDNWGSYIGLSLFFVVCGFVTWLSASNIFYMGQATMMPVFIVINWTMFFLIHISTMKSIADEKKNGTIELLLTKPIKTSELIAGKFLSQLIIAAFLLVLTVPYYLTIASLSHIDHGSVLLGYYGLLALCGCYISMGIFASSVAQTPLAAFFISLSIGLCFQLLFGILGQQIGSGWLADTFTFLSMDEHFESLARGVCDSRDILFFCSIITIFLILSKLTICKNRF